MRTKRVRSVAVSVLPAVMAVLLGSLLTRLFFLDPQIP